MNLRTFGTAFLFILLVWLGLNALNQWPKNAAARSRGPEGFHQKVDGIGFVEFAFDGEIELVAENRLEGADSVLREAWLSVKGNDPRPKTDGMQLTQVRIRSLGEAAETGTQYSVNAPSGHIPLLPQAPTPELDTSKPWLLDKPVMELPNFLGQDSLQLSLVSAELDAPTGSLSSTGDFQVRSKGLFIEGTGLHFNGQTRALKLGLADDSRVLWSIVSSNQSTLKASCSQGQLHPTNDPQTQSLTLEGNTVLTLPAAALNQTSGETIVRSPRLELSLRQADNGWSLLGGRAQAPTVWASPDGIASGQDCVFRWDRSLFEEMELQGPVHVETTQPADGWLSTPNKAILTSEHVLLIPDDAEGGDGQHEFQSDRLELKGASRSASGNVALSGPKGTIRANEAGTDDGLTWWFESDVIGTHVLEGQSWELKTEHAVHRPEGIAQAGPRFSFSSATETVTGNLLSTRHVNNQLAVTATGDVQVLRDDMVAHGERLDQRGGQTILAGKPTRASFAIQEEQGFLKANRLVRQQDSLHLHGEPSLDLPAQQLGLVGDRIHVQARRIWLTEEDGVWHLSGDVTFSGALTGNAERASWSPRSSLHLKNNSGGVAVLKGQRENEGPFSLEATSIQLDPNGSGSLSQNAVASFTAPDGASGMVSGNHILFRENGGRASGNAKVVWTGWTGSSSQAHWGFADDGWQLELIRGAELDGPSGRAIGERILYRHGPQRLRVEAKQGGRAKLLLKEGGGAEGDWLEYSLTTKLISSGSAKYSTP